MPPVHEPTPTDGPDLLAVLAERAVDPAVLVSGDDIVYANDAARRMLGPGAFPLDAGRWYRLFGPWSGEVYTHQLLPRAVRDGHSADMLSVVADGQETFVVATVVATSDAARHACSLRATGRVRPVADASGDAARLRSILDGTGRFVETDPETAAAFGIGSDDLAGAVLAELVSEGDRRVVHSLFGEGTLGHVRRLNLHPRHDPSATLTVTATPLRHGNADDARFALTVEADPASLEAVKGSHRHAATAELGHRALSADDPTAVFAEVADLVARELRMPFAVVAELDDTGDEMVLRAAANMDPSMLGSARFPNLRIGSSDRSPLVIEDLSHTPVPLPETLLRWGLRSYVSVPILLGDRTFGWIAALHTEPTPHAPEDVSWLQELSTLLSNMLRRAEDQELLRYRALHDPLTGLPNRDVLRDELATALDGSASGEVAVLFCDLDDFKIVNDSLGHPTGDRLLAALARRLRHAAGDSDVIVRFGGDEFVMITRTGGEAEARDAAERLLGTVADPFVIDEREIFLRASVGIAVSTGPEDDPARLIRDADAAMYRAKQSGRSRVEVFDRPMRAEVLAALDTEHALHRAISRGELLLHYQPVVRLADGAVCGCEALVRWRRANGSMQSPASFVPIAETTGLIVQIGAWVLEQACHQLVAWRRAGAVGADFTMSVNVSARELAQANYGVNLTHALERTGADPARLLLEVTESALLEDPEHAHSVLESIRDLGVGVSLDDFGTGYSSLSRLEHVPVDELKIDRSFVDGLGIDDWDTAIVGAILGLARVRDLRVVAEGVESALQARLLADAGCHYAQGFHFAHPAPAELVRSLLSQQLSPTSS